MVESVKTICIVPDKWAKENVLSLWQGLSLLGIKTALLRTATHDANIEMLLISPRSEIEDAYIHELVTRFEGLSIRDGNDGVVE